MKSKTTWTADEWEAVTRRAFAKRLRHPEMSLIQIANLVQEGLPAERRRLIRTTQEIGPLLAGVRRLNLETATLEQELAAMRDRLETLQKRPSRDEVLNGLSDDEAVSRFGKRILARLGGLLAELVLERWRVASSVPPSNGHGGNGQPINGHAPTPKPPAPKPAPPRPPRVAFYVNVDRYRAEIVNKIEPAAQCVFVHSNRGGRSILPVTVDLGVIWKSFAPTEYAVMLKEHLNPEYIVQHAGGVKTLIAKVQKRLASMAHS